MRARVRAVELLRPQLAGPMHDHPPGLQSQFWQVEAPRPLSRHVVRERYHQQLLAGNLLPWLRQLFRQVQLHRLLRPGQCGLGWMLQLPGRSELVSVHLQARGGLLMSPAVVMMSATFVAVAAITVTQSSGA